MYQAMGSGARAACWLLTLLSAAGLVQAKTASMFADEDGNAEPLEIHLSGPLRTMARDRGAEPEERAGTLSLSNPDLSYAVTLRPRGKSRRDPINCKFPPLWVQFDKDEVKDSPFAGHHRRKLVTHCRRLTGKNADESKVWLEMLAYRTLNLLTDASFRVQPLKITYEDSAKPGKHYVHPGFFIEHKKELARRLDTKLADVASVTLASLDAQYSALTALFNLFIGNPDFSLRKGPPNDNCCHNTVPFSWGPNTIRSIAYDFDNTGLVNPPYSTTPDNLRIKRVTQRVYRGYCPHNDSVPAAVAQFVSKRAAIVELFESQPGISKAERTRVLRFVNRFFQDYVEPKDQQRRIQEKCLRAR